MMALLFPRRERVRVSFDLAELNYLGLSLPLLVPLAELELPLFHICLPQITDGVFSSAALA